MQVVVATPLAAKPVEPLVELTERRSLLVGAGGVDLAEGVDEKSVVVAVVGVDVSDMHIASYVSAVGRHPISMIPLYHKMHDLSIPIRKK